MASKWFPTKDLRDLLLEDAPDGYEVVLDKLEETSRWSKHFKLIFKAPDGLLYQTHYSSGATEYQDESPFEYEGETISCFQVEAYETKVISYRPVK